jgi:hypothetical protein
LDYIYPSSYGLLDYPSSFGLLDYPSSYGYWIKFTPAVMEYWIIFTPAVMDYKITPAVLDSPIILNTLATFTKKIFKPPPPTLQIIPNFIYRFFKFIYRQLKNYSPRTAKEDQ